MIAGESNPFLCLILYTAYCSRISGLLLTANCSRISGLLLTANSSRISVLLLSLKLTVLDLFHSCAFLIRVSYTQVIILCLIQAMLCNMKPTCWRTYKFLLINTEA